MSAIFQWMYKNTHTAQPLCNIIILFSMLLHHWRWKLSSPAKQYLFWRRNSTLQSSPYLAEIVQRHAKLLELAFNCEKTFNRYFVWWERISFEVEELIVVSVFTDASCCYRELNRAISVTEQANIQLSCNLPSVEKDIDNKAEYSDSFTVISAEEGDGIAFF